MTLLVPVLAVLITMQADANASEDYRTSFKPVPAQYIAALADPDASSGDNAQSCWAHTTLVRGSGRSLSD